MFVLFALIPFLLMLALWRRQVADWRDRFLLSSVCWGASAVAMIEGLSVLNAITIPMVCGGWVIVAVAVCAVAKYLPRNGIASQSSADPVGPERSFLLPQLFVIAGILAVAACVGPPNNWDSMSYHMTRVMHWIQDRNVGFYPTASLRQLQLAPGAEYLILHAQLLSGNDRLDNLIQWFAYVGSVIGVSAIARSLGGSTRAQVFSAVFAATLPMVCLQTGTTQNDLVSAFWLVCLIHCILRLAGAARTSASWGWCLGCGASLGLALLTKSTMYVICLPFVVGLITLLLWRYRFLGAKQLAALALLVAALNAPMWCRNYRSQGTLLGFGGYPSDRGQYRNVHPDAKSAASNFLRNLSLELTVNTPGEPQAVEHATRVIHRWLHLNPDDPGTTFHDGGPYGIQNLTWNSEDYAPNPFHILLIGFAGLTILFRWRRADRAVRWYAMALACGCALFCGYLRYQPWNCRLHVPMLITAAVFVGIILDRHWKPWLANAAFAVLPVLVMPWILTSYIRPLVGRETIFDQPRDEQYFKERIALYPKYQAIVDRAVRDQVKQVAVIGDGNCWEYPLIVMLREKLPDVRVEASPTRLEWTPQKLHTRNLGFDPNLKPCLTVSLRGEGAEVVETK